MITLQTILSNTETPTWRRAMNELVHTGKILQRSENRVQNQITISARVRGSKKFCIYDTEVVFDVKQDQILDSSCSCPAKQSELLCKHCVALMIEYYRKQNREDPEVSRRSTRDRKKELRTDPQLAQLLKKQVTMEKIMLTQRSLKEKLELEPTVNRMMDGRLLLEFRIGAKKRYVVKDLPLLTRLFQSGEFYRYGEKLQFYHHMEVLTSESRELLGFIRREIKRGKCTGKTSNWYDSAPKTRYLTLDESNLDEFMEMLEKTLAFWKEEYLNEKCDLQLIDAVPEQKLVVTGRDGGVQMDGTLYPAYLGDRFVYFLNPPLCFRVPRREYDRIHSFYQYLSEKQAGGPVGIGKAELPMLCQDILPRLGQVAKLEYQDFVPESYQLPPLHFEIYLDAPQKDAITAKTLAVYGEGEKAKKYSVFSGGAIEASRDYESEFAMADLVRPYFQAFDEKSQEMMIQGDEDLLYRFLTEAIPRFREKAEVFLSDELQKMRVKPMPKLQMGIALSEDLLQLELTSQDMSFEELAEIFSHYTRKKRYYRLKNGTFLNMEEGAGETVEQLRQLLQLRGNQLKSEQITVPKYRALYLENALSESGLLQTRKNRSFRALVRSMKTVEENDAEVPETLQGILREYQIYGFRWLQTLYENGFGGILADDMGLGKTLQVLAFLLYEYEEKQEKRDTLIVCPASLVYNWCHEIQKFAHTLRAVMVVGNAAARQELLEQNAETGTIFITSYDLLKRDISKYQKHSFFCQVIDEAQAIKNSSTQAAQAVKAVVSGFRLALTGTPIENRLSELWSIFDYLMPGFLFSYKKFRDSFESPIVQDQDEQAMLRLKKMIGPFFLRRLKKDVLKDLPDKLEESVYTDMKPEQEKLYRAHIMRMKLLMDQTKDEEFNKTKILVLSELTKLRQLCCDPSLLYEEYKERSSKLELCLELVKNGIEGNHRMLIFSQFTTMLDRIRHCLEEEGISYLLLTGATSKEERNRLVEEFQTGKIPVFLISLKAGGTGLNLTAADMVIHFDPWWNVAAQNQATDRVHRIGQEQVVSVYRLFVKNSIEEKIEQLQEKKKQMADSILEGNTVGMSFTKDELLELLS